LCDAVFFATSTHGTAHFSGPARFLSPLRMVWRKNVHHRQIVAAPVRNVKVPAGIGPEGRHGFGRSNVRLAVANQQDHNGRKAASSL
jgi:hypothetical protein